MPDTHPLNAYDEQRSKARIADIGLGLTNPLDRHYWRDKLEVRIRMLDEDAEAYGLVPHETEELAALKRLKEKDDERSV